MQTIVWDIDDVLNNLMQSWFEESWLPSHPDCRLSFIEITENPPHRLLGVDSTHYLDSLDQFRLSTEADRMIPDAFLLEWFRKYGPRFRHIALTARPVNTISPAVQWTLRYFGSWFQSFGFVPAKRPDATFSGPDKTKEQYLAWLGKADYFIDDSSDNISAATSLGIQAFLVKRPWNRGGSEIQDILGRILLTSELLAQEEH